MSNKDHQKPKEPEAPPAVEAQQPLTSIPDATTGTGVAIYDFGSDAGAGMENVSQDEYALPFLKIAQTNSAVAVDEDQGGLGIKPGSIYNAGTGEWWSGKEGVDVVFVFRDHNFIERWPFESGKGFVGIRSEDDDTVLALQAKSGKFGKLITGEGTEIAETYYLYGIVVDADRNPTGRFLAPFSSTQIKKYRAFMSFQMSLKYPSKDRQGRPVMVNPPLWSHIYHLSTVPETGKKGKYAGWRITLKELPKEKSFVRMSDPLYAVGRDFYQQIAAGSVRADYSKVGPDDDASAEDAKSDGQPPIEDGEEVPF